MLKFAIDLTLEIVQTIGVINTISLYLVLRNIWRRCHFAMVLRSQVEHRNRMQQDNSPTLLGKLSSSGIYEGI